MKRFLLTLILTVCSVCHADDNVVILLDASGSMYDSLSSNYSMTKIEAAKKALTTTVKNISPTTNLGILVFSASGIDNEWIYTIQPVGNNKEQIISKINSIIPNGGTPLGAYMKAGADALLLKRTKEKGAGTYRFLIVTDGEAGDSSLVDEYLPDILSRGIVVDVIGVDMSQSHSLANKVHSYQKAEDVKGLETAIATVLAEVSSSSKDASVNFELMEGLNDKDATLKIVEAISFLPNQPIGEKPETGVTVYPIGQKATPPTSSNILLVVFSVIAVVIVVFIGTCILCSNCS